MTANAMAADREKCLDAGMNDHIGKLIDPDQLFSLLLEASSESSIGSIDTNMGLKRSLREGRPPRYFMQAVCVSVCAGSADRKVVGPTKVIGDLVSRGNHCAKGATSFRPAIRWAP